MEQKERTEKILYRYDVMKLRILRWGSYSGLPRQALNTLACVLIKEADGDFSHKGEGRGGNGQLKMEVETGMMQSLAKEFQQPQKI